jgi:uracil-DNA glycosylase family 4
MEQIATLHRTILNCTLCQDAGYIERAAPVVAGRAGNRIMLIGQAPGITELQIRRPFAGRAGRELFRWMSSIGIAEGDFRHHVYMTAITKCFPGKATSGSGDRRPSSREITLCRPYLERQLALIDPDVVLLVGGLAIERYFPRVPLHELIGRTIDVDDRSYIPLPHPSGASRWLNDAGHKRLLREALEHVRGAWDAFVPAHEVVTALG